jgi:glycosyltransferase involved in cell wall biosynthesis
VGKILINARYLNSNITGIERVILEMILAFHSPYNIQARKHQIILNSPPLKYAGICESVNAGKKFDSTIKKMYFDLIEYGKSAYNTGAHLLVGPSFTVPYFSQIPRLCCVYDLSVLKFEKFYDKKTRLFFRHIVVPSIKRASGILTISKAVKQDIISILGLPSESVHYAYPPISDDVTRFYDQKNCDLYFDSGKKPKPVNFNSGILSNAMKNPYFVCPGSLHPRKNQHTLLKAFEMFSSVSKVKYNLIIAGHHTFYYPHFKEVLKTMSNKFRERVILTGYLDQQDLLNIIYGAESVVFPSLSEGFGYPPLEAMALGVPVVAGRCSAVEEVCGRDVIYCDPLDICSISRAMYSSVKNLNLRKSLIRQGRKRALSFNRERYSIELEKIFDQYI